MQYIVQYTEQKNYRHQRCIKILWDITLQQGERQRPQMARRMLGDFYINLQFPPSHIPRSQFQQGNCPGNYPQFGPTQIVLFETPGEIGTPSGVYWQSSDLSRSFGILTYFTDFIIVQGVRCAQCRNLQGHWIQATYPINAAIPRELCEDWWAHLTWTECSRPWMGWYQHRWTK